MRSARPVFSSPTRVRMNRMLAPLRAVYPEALLFDCDGVLVDTEKDGHRVAFNRAFQEKGLGFEWSVEK